MAPRGYKMNFSLTLLALAAVLAAAHGRDLEGEHGSSPRTGLEVR